MTDDKAPEGGPQSSTTKRDKERMSVLKVKKTYEKNRNAGKPTAPKHKGEGKGKAKPEEGERKLISVPSIAPALQSRFGIEPISLSQDFILRVMAVRTLALTMSGKRLVYNPIAPIMVMFLDLTTIAMHKMLHMHMKSTWLVFGESPEDLAAYTRLKSVCTISKLSNAGRILLDSIGEVMTADGVPAQSVHCPATSPACNGPRANEDIQWCNTDADETTFLGKWQLKLHYPQMLRFIGTELHPAFVAVLAMALSYRASFTQAIGILLAYFFQPAAGGPGPACNYEADTLRWLRALGAEWNRFLREGTATQWNFITRLVGGSTYAGGVHVREGMTWNDLHAILRTPEGWNSGLWSFAGVLTWFAVTETNERESHSIRFTDFDNVITSMASKNLLQVYSYRSAAGESVAFNDPMTLRAFQSHNSSDSDHFMLTMPNLVQQWMRQQWDNNDFWTGRARYGGYYQSDVTFLLSGRIENAALIKIMRYWSELSASEAAAILGK